MSITDEMVEMVCDFRGFCPGQFNKDVRDILEAYHRILSTQEPPEELVERVAEIIEPTMEQPRAGAAQQTARAAIKEVWRVG